MKEPAAFRSGKNFTPDKEANNVDKGRTIKPGQRALVKECHGSTVVGCMKAGLVGEKNPTDRFSPVKSPEPDSVLGPLACLSRQLAIGGL